MTGRSISRAALAGVAAAVIGAGASAPAQTVDPLAPTITADTAFAPPSGIAKFDFTSGTAADVVGGTAVDGERIYTMGETRDGTGNANIGIIARRPDGTFDTGFSEDGKHTVPIAAGTGRDAGFAIVVLGDHRLRLLAATDVDPGSGTNLDVAIVGLNADGSTDTGFGGGTGNVVFPVGAGNDTPTRMAADAAGRLALSGTTVANGKDDFFVSLRNADGSPAAFGTAGVRTFNRGGGNGASSLNDRGTDVAFRPGGGIVALLQVETNPDANLTDWHAILRAFTEDGSDDTAFSDDGELDLPIGTPDTIPGGLLAYDGRIWVTGSTKTGVDTDAFLARVNADGSGLQQRLFDMRGRATAPEQAVTSQGNDLDVVPGLPSTLVVGGFLTGDAGTDWAAAAFNGLERDVTEFRIGDVVLTTPGQGTIVGVVSAGAGWVAAAGSLLDLNSADTSFGSARLLLDVEKQCDLGIELLAPLEVTFQSGRPVDVQVKVTNDGTKTCAGEITAPAPYQLLTAGVPGPVATGPLAPGASVTPAGLSLAYAGSLRREDVVALRVAAVGDANAANDSRNVRVVFRFCDVRLRAASSPAVAPVEGARTYELTIRNVGTARCLRSRIGVASGGSRSGLVEQYTLAAGRSVSEDVRVALDRTNRARANARIELRAQAFEDADAANDSVVFTPAVVGIGDSAIRRAGRRALSGTASPSRARKLSKSSRRVARVEIAVRRLGTRGRCSWLASRNVRFRTYKAGAGGACSPRAWLRARGTRRWRLSLRRALPPGRYVAYSRAVIRAGFGEASFSTRDRNRVAFRVR